MRGIWIWVITVDNMKAAVASPAPELPPPASSAYSGTTESSNWKPKSAAKATRVSNTTGRVNKDSRSGAPDVRADPFTPLTLQHLMPWVARAVREPPYRGAVLTPAPRGMDDVDHASLYGYVLRRQDEVLVVAVLGFETQEVTGFALFAVEAFDGYFFAVLDQGRDHGTVRRVFGLLHDQEVAVRYVSPDHGLPHDSQQVAPLPQTRPHELGGERVGLILYGHGLEPASGSDPAQDRHLPRGLPALLREPDAPRPSAPTLDVTDLLQPLEILVRRLRAPETNGLPQLAHARRSLTPRLQAGQILEHLHPSLPVLRNHPGLLVRHAKTLYTISP